MGFDEEGVLLLPQGRFDEHIPQLRLQAGVKMVFRLFDEDGFSLRDDTLNDHRQDLADAKADIGEADVDAGIFIARGVGNRDPGYLYQERIRRGIFSSYRISSLLNQLLTF